MPVELPPPSPWVVRHAGWIPDGGAVLDVACGSGRHTRLFLDRGHPVTAVDRDPDALAAGDDPRLTRVAADLEREPWPLRGRRFAAVVVTNFLWRPLFDDLCGAVDDGGWLIYDTFAVGQERFGRPKRAEYLLRDGELIELVGDRLTVVRYEHGLVAATASVSVRQRIVAVRESDLTRLGDWRLCDPTARIP